MTNKRFNFHFSFLSEARKLISCLLLNFELRHLKMCLFMLCCATGNEVHVMHRFVKSRTCNLVAFGCAVCVTGKVRDVEGGKVTNRSNETPT